MCPDPRNGRKGDATFHDKIHDKEDPVANVERRIVVDIPSGCAGEWDRPEKAVEGRDRVGGSLR